MTVRGAAGDDAAGARRVTGIVAPSRGTPWEQGE